MEISSPAFADGEGIPSKYTFDGQKHTNPPLLISGGPGGAESFVLIAEDIDSPIGRFTHWLVWNIPAQTREIGENAVLPQAEAGLNGFGEIGYAGPCPPSGSHRYRFHLFALDTILDLTSPERRDVVESEMEGHVLAQATLTGLYQARVA